MLIFKNNIYAKSKSVLDNRPKAPLEYYDLFEPLEFIQSGLAEESQVLSIIERQPKVFWNEDTRNFYPQSHKVGPLKILHRLQQVLLQGLEDQSSWQHMNCYHFCFLFDVLKRHAFNYNHDSLEERVKTVPSMRGKLVYFELLVRDYFFGTPFMMSPEQFNVLSPDEKQANGLTNPCLFAVINGLLPTREEITLKESTDYPYSIYV